MKKKLSFLLIIVTFFVLFLPSVALANSFNPSTGQVIIDSVWTPGSLKASVNVTGATDNQVVKLKIDASSTINQTDANYLTNDLPNLEEINVTSKVSFVAVFNSFMSSHPNLKTATLASSVVAYDGIFMMSDKLEIVSLPQVKDVGENAFFHCDLLSSVDMPLVEEFESNAFSNCKSLSKISLPKAEILGNEAFINCTSLSKVSMPKARIFLRSPFNGCTSLKKISLPRAISFGNRAFENCTALLDVSLPKATAFGNDAFMQNDALINISLPSVTSLGTGIFRRCDLLKSASLNSLTTLPSFSFITCPNVKSVSLLSLTSFEDRIFDGATGPIVLKMGSAVPTTLATSFSAYDPLLKGAVAKVPKNSVATYDAADAPIDGLWNGFTIRGINNVVENPQTGEKSNFNLSHLSVILIAFILTGSVLVKHTLKKK